MRTYEVILHEQAWTALHATKGADRQRLLDVLDQVKTTPFRPGDYRQRDATGRVNEVVLIGQWLVTFWSDHAVGEIRVVELERADE